MNMNLEARNHPTESASVTWRSAARWFATAAIHLTITGVVLFSAAGRLDWIPGLVLLGAYLAVDIFAATLLFTIQPGLLDERTRIKAGTKTWDKVVVRLHNIPVVFLIPLVAGLDFRFGWTTVWPVGLCLTGLGLFTLGHALIQWAIASNAYFSGVVRIQKERGHTTQTGGPYRVVRHPGYAGMIISDVGVALLLGSPWALIPAGAAVIAILVRTALEDRTLREELAGYDDYAGKVRYRLVPGLW